MFNRKKRNGASALPTSKEVCLLGLDVHFEGRVRFEGSMAIDGTVIGEVQAPSGSGSTLTVNQQGVIKGDVTADTVLISGRVEGDVHAKERVELLRTGVLKGDMYTRDVMIEGGAGFDGFCHMERDGEVVTATPAEAARGEAGGDGSGEGEGQEAGEAAQQPAQEEAAQKESSSA